MAVVHVCAICGTVAHTLASHAGGLQFHEVAQMAEDYIPTKRLYLAQDGETVVEEGDPTAASLLAVPGIPVEAAIVERYKLKERDKAGAKVEDKQQQPDDDKSGPARPGARRQ